MAEHLRAFIRDVLGDGGQEVGGREHLEAAVGIEPGVFSSASATSRMGR
jgi:hypothetical protein